MLRLATLTFVPIVLALGNCGLLQICLDCGTGQCRAELPAAKESTRASQAQDEPFGLSERVPWTSSRVTGSPNPPSPYALDCVFPKLQFTNPVVLTNAPGTDRLFVVELRGKIFSFSNRADVAEPELAIDLAEQIDGMTRVYGLAFHPDFARNRLCYVCYILQQDQPEGTRVSRFTVTDDDPPRIDPSSEQVLLTWRSGGHNGGCLKFGPDGCLYISTGDGSPPFPPDQFQAGQDVSTLLSSILRIDVDRADEGRRYGIPADNPFVKLDNARGEIWAFGFRNPWKMSFDSENGDLWVGDVGWELWEMIYRVERGGNYGWSLVEADQVVHRDRPRGPTPILPPTAAHSHIESRSITGGFVYRGRRLDDLYGAYIYGDYVTGKLWGLRHDGEQITWQEELLDSPLQVICFGVDRDQELYVVGYDGTIHRLVRNDGAQANREFPTRLSETGLFSSVPDHQMAPGVIAYSINAEPWADYATAERFIALPGTTTLGVHETSNPQVGDIKGQWKYPPDAVLVKTVSLEMTRGDSASRRRLETQLLHYDVDTWRAYTYAWNDEQTDATLVPAEGADRTFTIRDKEAPTGNRQQAWRFAARSECILCHTTRGGSIYGFTPAQLNRLHDYDDAVDNQLRTLSHIGLFDNPIEETPPKLPNPHDSSVSLEQRARAYLHVNCSHCHLRGGGGTAAIEIQYDRPLDQTHLLSTRPTQGTFGIHSAEIVAPGDPYRSILYYRMSKLGRGRMPYFGSSVVDQQGVKLIHDWIKQLPPNHIPDSVVKADQSRGDLLNELRSPDVSTPDQRQHAIADLMKSTSGALALLRDIDDCALSDSVREQAIALGTTHEDTQVRDLFERFVPEEQRTRRLGNSIEPEKILALRGVAEQGQRLFFGATGVQCVSCHRIGEKGTPVGPDLTQIGRKYDRAQLLETILEPSKRIEPQYVTHIIETGDGRVYSGLLIKKNAKEVILKDAYNKIERIPAGDIELLTVSQLSIMPDLLLRDMTAEQVADLLEYLHSLK